VTATTPREDSRFVAERLLDTVREDIGRADTKASILLSAALALPALLLGGHWSAGRAGAALVLPAVGAGLWVLGTAALVRAILPRTGTVRGRSGLTYFGDLLSGEAPHLLAARVTEAARDPVGWLLVQSVDVAGILATKYRWIRRGVYCLTAGAALVAGGLLLH
jgi:hypothetical protein